MKRFLVTPIFSIFLMFMSFSFAAHSETPPSDIEVVMERMDDNLKLISKGIRSGTMDSSHVDAIEALQTNATEAALLPLPGQALCEQLLYQRSMLELIGQALQMETEIEAAVDGSSPQNLDGVTAVWKNMSDLRKQGHKDCQEPE